MIRAVFAGDRVTLSGHAGFGPKGSDLVCAGVSVLVETTAALLSPAHVCLGDGFAVLQLEGKGAFLKTGLELLERDFPECVEVRER